MVRLLDEYIVGSCEALLDVGCGTQSPIPAFSDQLKRSMGVDGNPAAISASIHSEHTIAGVEDLLTMLGPGSFDAMVALNLASPEGLGGLLPLDALDTIAAKEVVICTLKGFLEHSAYEGNQLQQHRSGWLPEDSAGRRDEVIGLYAWRPLSGERGDTRLWQKRAWQRIGLLSIPWAERHPRYPFQLLFKQVGAVPLRA